MNIIEKYGDKAEEIITDVKEFLRLEREEYLKKYLDKRVKIEFHGLILDVIINDIKVTYKGTQYQVTPLNGSKHIWVEKIIS